MRRSVAIAGTLTLGVALFAAAGCSRQTVGPTTADFQKQRALVVEKQKQMAALQLPSKGAKKEGDAGGSMGGSLGFVYDPIGRRDPFRSFILDRLNEEGKQAKGPLEEYDLSQLAVVGVVWDAERPRALVEDPSGRGYVVSEGTAMGKNEGRVITINDNLVLVRETYVDYVGDKTTKDIPMRIRQGREG